ncbi:similar to Saccharomyces cerevisiae YLR244C MAP1 Methionine aminopeptidase, catalyzes the cotranslational removal of N-terminal methionine from nascent polypeptides [Maudiozyma barnettii]|uniref:Methionine aminopeptidase n=1 Tax=Maudiozyma barnettii TaxID=61262 RepID=A0A8H2VGK3_9SACH|nr:methionine aminopeptidase MAP1 [Kazachstania barnettii]CAB4254789.1 similar to Saccharomyces cerevisiae YLR244C MAP1 Methionine aminopeptidase, catalyzes the cotranslational removal of N-terminal methionine from nascent polypeptides [Kazachstania barnettii]CAD1782941.1 similar to Saccharomyces cerevisiae YLR244C MAP1 Methionine aminopeptidase, catalyzes the cotranslational removal of N-terminal methionine from nascent polypeptides [Kazachstania barnettii]
MSDSAVEKVYCAGLQCGKETESQLKCPICLKNGIVSVFCDEVCYKNNYKSHKALHFKEGDETGEVAYNPFPKFKFGGDVRPNYPLTPKRYVPENIEKPDWSQDGLPVDEQKNDRTNEIPVYTKEEIKKIRKACVLGREVLDIAAAAVKPGVTTDEIDKIVHEETIKRNCYPSPLNYYNFPKSVCTSINEVICHGIPDKTVLKEGDIVNLDVSLYYQGFHADLNETYYVIGDDESKLSKEAINTVETARECLKIAIKQCKPGTTFQELGDYIEKHASENKCSVVKTYCGHGVGKYFHCAPSVPHYKGNRTAGVMKPGMIFTIEPMINEGTWKDATWPDDWTSTTQDGKRSAQFEHTLMVTEHGVEILSARNKKSPGGPRQRIK